MVSVEGKGYSAQDKTIVSHGKFQTLPFSNQARPLKGSYRVEFLSYFTPMWHEKDILGKLGHYRSVNIETEDSFGEKSKVLKINKNYNF